MLSATVARAWTIEDFEPELAKIKDADLRQLTRSALAAAPAWFWTAPSSSSGRYHPPDSNDIGGTCRHSVKVSWIAARLAEAHDIDPDILRSAGLVHDITKFGSDDEMETGKERPQYKEHGRLGAERLQAQSFALPKGKLERKWATVCTCVRTHMGKYGPDPPKTMEQFILHHADMAVSYRQLVALQFYDPDAYVELTQKDTQAELDKFFAEHENGELVWKVGRNKGMTINELITVRKRYVQWLLGKKRPGEHDFPESVKEIFQKALNQRAMEKDGLLGPQIYMDMGLRG